MAAEAARTLVKLAGKCADIGCRGAARAASARKLPWRPSVVQAVTFEHWRGMAAASILRAAYDAAPQGRQARRAHARDPRAASWRWRTIARRGRLELVPACGGARVDERERARVDGAGAGRQWAGPELAKLAASPHAAVREAAAEGADAATTKKLLGDDDAAVVAAAAERAEALKLADGGAARCARR